MGTSERQHEILRHLYLAGYVEVKELAATLDVDLSTIRRDLETLAHEGRVQRTHGGARPPAGAVDLPYAVKQGERLAAKRGIATAACALVRDGDSVLLDAGSTTYVLATELRNRRNLTIVTNDLLIANVVADYPGVRLLVAGGELLTSTYTLCGERAVAFLQDLRVDWAFLGADAVDIDSGITNTNTLEVPLKRMMIAVASHSVVLADSSKFGQRALVRVAEISEVDRIVTDDQLDEQEAVPYGDRLERTEVSPLPATALALPFRVQRQGAPGQAHGSLRAVPGINIATNESAAGSVNGGPGRTSASGAQGTPSLRPGSVDHEPVGT